MKILLGNTAKRGSGKAKCTSLRQVLGLAGSIGRQAGIVFIVKTH